MKQPIGPKKSIINQIAYTASYGAQFSLPSGLFIEMISNLQVISIILQTSFPDHKTAQGTIFFHHIRPILSLVGFLSSPDPLDKEDYKRLFWFMYSTYLSLYSMFMLILIGYFKQRVNISRRIAKLCTQINIIHSKLLFCPISYFYLKMIDDFKTCDLLSVGPSFTCKTPLIVLTIFFLTINFSLAFAKETLFYQTYQSENPFAVKSNFHAKIQLVHKVVVMSFMILMKRYMVVSSILNVALTSIYHLSLFITFPLYNLKCLKTAIVFSSVSMTSSFVLLWKEIFDNHPMVFEFLVLILNPMMLKLSLRKMDSIFENILTLNSNSSNHIAHLNILINEHILDEKVSSSRILKFTNMLKKIGFTKLDKGNIEEVKECNKKIHEFIVNELLRCLQKNPRAKLILFLLVQFYIEEVKNISSAIIYISKLQNLSGLTVPELNTIEYLRCQLQKHMTKSYVVDHKALEYFSYFRHKEISVKLKEDIKGEVNLHLDLWKALVQEKVNIYQVLNISMKLDCVASRVQKTWQDSQNDFENNFPGLVIMFGVYLSIIRGVCNLGKGVLEKLHKEPRLIKSLEKWIKQDDAIIIISNQKENLGKVLHASDSVRSYFNINQSELVGKKINMLMPSMIQKKHDSFIERFSEKSGFSFGSEWTTYCKTIDGKFFQSSISVKIYPEIDREAGLIAKFNKREEIGPILFVDVEGNILDYSQELLNKFGVESREIECFKIQDICPEFELVNKAFNVVFNSNIQPTKKTFRSGVEDDTYESLKSYHKSNQTMADKSQAGLLLYESSYRSQQESSLDSQGIQYSGCRELAAYNSPQKKTYKEIYEEFTKGKVVLFTPKSRKSSTKIPLEYFIKVKCYYLKGSLIKTFEFLQKINDQRPQKHENAFHSSMQILEYSKKTEPSKAKEDVKFNYKKSSSYGDNQQTKGKNIEKAFYEIFHKEKVSNFVQVYLILFYFGIVLILGLAALGLILTRISFSQINLGVRLMKADRERAENLMSAWMDANLLYKTITHSNNEMVQLNLARSISEKSNTINQLNKEILCILADVKSDSIVKEFLKLDFSFWGEYNGRYDDSLLFSSFTGVNVALNALNFFANQTRTSFLSNAEPAIFGLNNSVNGLLLSIEGDFDTIEEVKSDIFDSNLELLIILFITQDGSVLMVLLSLVFIIIKIHKSHERLLKAIAKISPEGIKIRKQQLKCFNQCLKDSSESYVFAEQLYSFFEKYKGDKESYIHFKVIDFKDSEKNYVVKLNKKDILLSALAFFLFMLIIGLLSLSNLLSLNSMSSLQNLNRISQTTETLGYETYLSAGSFIYWVNFYNNTDMQVREQSIENQLEEIMKNLLDTNIKTLESFSLYQNNFDDPIFEGLLFNNICTFMDKNYELNELCKNATHDNSFGLVELNVHHHETYSQYIEKFKSDSQALSSNTIFNGYLDELVPMSKTLWNTYDFLREHLLQVLNSEVADHDITRTLIFIITCIVCILVAIILRIFVLERVLLLEKERYKVLKAIPQNLLLANRIIVSFLKKEFAEELAEIKSIL